MLDRHRCLYQLQKLREDPVFMMQRCQSLMTQMNKEVGAQLPIQKWTSGYGLTFTYLQQFVFSHLRDPRTKPVSSLAAPPALLKVHQLFGDDYVMWRQMSRILGLQYQKEQMTLKAPYFLHPS